MKQIKGLWGNIPRKIRAGINVLLILFLLLIIYIGMGSPVFTLQQRFRRAEKAYLVGPGEIVDHTQWGLYSEFTDMLVAETEYGVMFYGYWDQKFPLEDCEVFSYREKTGKLTFLAPPSLGFSWSFQDFGRIIPLYLFDDYPEAVRAEASVRARGTHQVNDTKTPFDMCFAVSADRFSDGVFRFLLELESGQPLKLAAAQMLTEISTTAESWPYCTTSAFYKEPHADITIRLYDEDNNLIVEEELVLRTVAAEAQARRGEWPPAE